MKKRLIYILIIVIMAFPLMISATTDEDVVKSGDSGSDVYAIQRRLCDLGYLNYRPTGKFSDMTASAVRKFQQLNGISADGQIGESTRQKLFSEDVVRNTANPEFKRTIGPAHNGEMSGKAELSAWEAIDSIFPVGSTITVKDYNTGSSLRVRRVGGVNCAHVVTETPDDYDTFVYIFGGETWEHRSVFANIGGKDYAASLFGTPTGTEPSPSENMKGYTILYFNHSKTDVQALPDAEHDLAVMSIASS